MFNKYNFSIKDFCASNPSRPEISGVFVKPNESVATDSFTLIRVSTPKVNVEDYPQIPNKPKPLSSFRAFILPKEKAGEVEKLFKSNNKSLPILENAVLVRRTNNEIEIGATDLESYNSVMSRITEGEFPKYNDILVERGKYVEITLNPEFLLKIAKFYNGFLEKKTKGIIVKVPIDKQSPVRFYAKRDDKQEAQALIMPIKTE